MVVGKTKQVTVATLLEALKNRPKIKEVSIKDKRINQHIVKIPKIPYPETYEKWFEDFEGLLLQFQKQLKEETNRLEEAFWDENFTALEQNCFKAISMKLNMILGDVAK